MTIKKMNGWTANGGRFDLFTSDGDNFYPRGRPEVLFNKEGFPLTEAAKKEFGKISITELDSAINSVDTIEFEIDKPE